MRWHAQFIALSVGLLAAGYFLLWLLGGFSDIELKWVIAAVLGVGLTSGLAIALMGLAFYSDRSDHDTEASDAAKSDDDKR